MLVLVCFWCILRPTNRAKEEEGQLLFCLSTSVFCSLFTSIVCRLFCISSSSLTARFNRYQFGCGQNSECNADEQCERGQWNEFTTDSATTCTITRWR